MARMYPGVINPNTESAAERQLYAAFRDSLDDDYVVFHSVAWQSPARDGRTRDGEADFVIAHPRHGILVIEAKGGIIRHDPQSGLWASVDTGNVVHPIHDPFNQAKTSKYVLRDQLAAMLGGQRAFTIGHAVAFPNVMASASLLGLDRPRDIVLDASDVADVAGWVRRALDYWRGSASRKDTAPGQAAVTELLRLLGKAWELRPALWGEFIQENQRLIQLTEQQFMILDLLNRQRRAAICGCAGSGKTMLAVEKATRLAAQGFRVLLACFNKSLAHDLRNQLKTQSNLDILHFHELAAGIAKQGGTLPRMADEAAYFREDLPTAMFEALAVVPNRYDAVIVDEGQDFEESWWTPLELLLHDSESGIFYIFYDDNQRIYVEQNAFPMKQEPYHLTVNCRNTQHIHRQVLRFYQGEVQPTALGPIGRPVEIVRYGAPGQVHTAVMKLLHRLAIDERVPTDELLVMTPLSPEKSGLQYKTPGRVTLADRLPVTPGQVFTTTIHNFKGLERSIVVLAEAERWSRDNLERLLYVACSRARNHLIVLLPQSTPDTLVKIFDVAASISVASGE